MIVLMKHSILEESADELKGLKAEGLRAEDILSYRDPNDYCIFGTGETLEELMKRYSAIAAVFPEVFELLRWDTKPADDGVNCVECGMGGGRVLELFICRHVVHWKCRRNLKNCKKCSLKVQEPRIIRIKHNWRFRK